VSQAHSRTNDLDRSARAFNSIAATAIYRWQRAGLLNRSAVKPTFATIEQGLITGYPVAAGFAEIACFG